MRGRIPRPVEQKRREGERPDRVPELYLVAGRPLGGELDDPPDDLPADAKRFWRKTVRRLVDVGMLDLVDEPALEMLSTQFARWKQAGRVLRETGHFSIGSTGQVKEHPAVRIEREAHQLFLKTAEQFGLTPVARTRLGLAELHRRSLHAEMKHALEDVDTVDGETVDGKAVDVDLGLPGA